MQKSFATKIIVGHCEVFVVLVIQIKLINFNEFEYLMMLYKFH
jgi:hypothetical protein